MDYRKTNAPTTTVTRDMMELCEDTGNVYESVTFMKLLLSLANVPTRLVWKSRMTFPKSLLSLPLTMIIWKKCSKTGNRLRFPAITKNCRSRH